MKGIYIEAGDFGGATPAQLQEIRQALLNFKKSGKFIVSYGDQYTQGTYYLASVADSVVINPEGMLDWKGLAFQTLYYKDVLDKVGVKMEIFKVGTYKSAVEPYFLTEMSDANREQITVFSDEIWKQMQSEVAKSRKLSSEQLNQLTDEGLTFKETNYYLKKKLVDKVAFSDEVPQMLAYCMDKTTAGDYNTISVTDLAASTSSEPKGTSGNVIAVYYAAGEIVESNQSSFGSMGEIIAADKVTKDLKDLANDDDVKAVVMRVNSPGGSAYGESGRIQVGVVGQHLFDELLQKWVDEELAPRHRGYRRAIGGCCDVLGSAKDIGGNLLHLFFHLLHDFARLVERRSLRGTDFGKDYALVLR